MRLLRPLLAGLLVAVAFAVPAASALDLVAEPNVLPDGVVGEAYHFEFEGEEGCPPSYDFHLHTGYLPPGLSIERRTGELEGVPTVPGDYHFFVELTDGEGPGACNSTPSQADFYLRVLPRLEVATASLGPVRLFAHVAEQLRADGGGTQSWSLAAGALPPGMTLSPEGLLAGVAGAPGTYTFTLRVQDPGPRRVGTRDFTLVVAGPLAASVAAPSRSEVGVRLAARVEASGGAAPFRFSVTGGALPPGVALDEATGALTGTPTAAGSYRATIAVADAVGQTAAGELAVTVAPRLALVTRTLPTATTTRAYRARLVARGGVAPVRWTLRGTLPPGLRLDPRAGTIVGTARAAGTRRITVTARDALGVAVSRTLVLRVR